MDKVEVRLKCLEIAQSKTVYPDMAISVAKKFEDFVYDREPSIKEVPKAQVPHPQEPLKKAPDKKIDTPRILP